MFAVQNFLVKDRIVTTFGWRKDELKVFMKLGRKYDARSQLNVDNFFDFHVPQPVQGSQPVGATLLPLRDGVACPVSLPVPRR